MRSYSAPPPRHSDPFFDKPYEPVGEGQASWEKGTAAPIALAKGLSANIRPKKKVAALLGGGR